MGDCNCGAWDIGYTTHARWCDALQTERHPYLVEVGREIAANIFGDGFEAPDLARCPYLRDQTYVMDRPLSHWWGKEEGAYGPATCGGGCWQEPECSPFEPTLDLDVQTAQAFEWQTLRG